MCFSAGASFGAGVVLSVIGVANIKKSQSPSQTLFASIPFLFAVQQVSEGFLWLSLQNPLYAHLQQLTTYVFLTFAEVIWPLLVPLAIFAIEPLRKRKNYLKIFVALGAIVSIYLTYCLINFPVEANALEHHISYKQSFPQSLRIYTSIAYAIATVIPLFISSIRRMWLFAVLVLVSYIIALFFYTQYVVSVWCFFASIISLSIFFILYFHNKASAKEGSI